MEEFDSEKFKLGSLCKRKHDWNGTGKTLRNHQRQCVECLKILEANRPARVWNPTPEQREALRLKEAKYRQENPEKVRETNRKSYVKHREKILGKLKQDRLENLQEHRARERAYDAKNRDRRNQQIKVDRASNPEKYRARLRSWYRRKTGAATLSSCRSKQKRRAAKRLNHAANYSNQDIKKRLSQFNNSCAYCQSTEKITLDHFLPIDKGGPDCLGNLIPACLSCNSSKKNHDPIEWYKAQSFFNYSSFSKILKVLGKDESSIHQLPLF